MDGNFGIKKRCRLCRIILLRHKMINILGSQIWHCTIPSAADMLKFSCPDEEANGECLVLALDSSHTEAEDCYRIVPSENNQTFKLVPLSRIASRPVEDLVLAISREFSTVALLDKSGIRSRVNVQTLTARNTPD